jgi:integrase
MAVRKTKRSARHKGVVLIKPDLERRIGWRARYKDPDSGKFVKLTLDPALTTLEQREAWATAKARELARRRLELQDGAARATGTALTVGIEKFFEANARLRPGTLENYRSVANKLAAWAEPRGIRTCDDLTRAKLAEFRTLLLNERKRLHLQGCTRTELRRTDQPRSAHTVNADLRRTGTILTQLIERDLFPRLKHDDLKRALKKIPAPIERVEFLRPHDCRKLLEACLRHDAETFRITRQEHDRQRPLGTTPRYEPVSPFIATLLLTGMRLGEAQALDWDQVELDAVDHEGRKVGEILLEGVTSKTHRARTIGLEVSPALRALLAAMRVRSGGRGAVFQLSLGGAGAAIKRLQGEYGAPAFSAQTLRRTCGTYLTNAPGIFGAASAYRSAKQLGHAVQVAERHYLGLVRGISRDAHTLEAAMQVEDVMAEVVRRVAEPEQRPSVALASSAVHGG